MAISLSLCTVKEKNVYITFEEKKENRLGFLTSDPIQWNFVVNFIREIGVVQMGIIFMEHVNSFLNGFPI